MRPVDRTSISDVLQGRAAPGAQVTVCGWLRSRRDSKGGFSFLELNDGSCLKSLQVIADQALENYQDEIVHLGTGAAIVAEGVIAESPGKGQSVELKAHRIACSGNAPADYPLQKKRHSFEFLREIAHLRPRTNAISGAMRMRHELAAAIHDFFRREGFLWVHTPIITASDAEGAGEMFRVTTLDAKAPPLDQDGRVNFKEDFFGRPTHLTVSGQLQAEAMACALSKVYTFGPTFRAENSNTARHIAEFWMVEPEVAFADLNDNAALAERFLQSVLKHVLDHSQEDLALFDQRVEPGLIASLEHVATEPFERMTYREAIDRLTAAPESFEYAPVFGQALQTEHERYLTEKLVQKPLIVTDYPAAHTAFYMRLNDDGETVRAMDVLVPRIGEIIGGSQREERYDVLVDRMRALGLDPDAYDWYLDLRKFGSNPHAGFGLGFERLVMFATGMKNIRDVMPFPRTPRHADF